MALEPEGETGPPIPRNEKVVGSIPTSGSISLDEVDQRVLPRHEKVVGSIPTSGSNDVDQPWG